MDSRPLWGWINERHAIFLRKELRAGNMDVVTSKWSNDYFKDKTNTEVFIWASKGYLHVNGTVAVTRDPILAEYRFCNVFRELDRVTQWIRYNIRRRYWNHPNLWFMLAIARTINWPDTLQYLMDGSKEHLWKCWPDKDNFDPVEMGSALDKWKSAGNKVYTGAYMIRAESNPKAEWYAWTKQQYIARLVLGRLWENRESWTNDLNEVMKGRTFLGKPMGMRDVWSWFQDPRYIGWGPFMAYQVVVDLRHTRYLMNAPDINSWAALGPGSRRGLNRLAGRPVDFPLKQEQGLEEMLGLYHAQDQFKAPWVPHIELSDIQNCLCETDKYLRVENNEGRPRAKYVPGRGF